MAQPKRNLASALAHLYLSRGGSESDLNDVMDSADIVAKLYHLLGGNVATPKGMPMAELVALLSTTQGGGGGESSPLPLRTRNEVNDSEITTDLAYDVSYQKATIIGYAVYGDDSHVAVEMAEDTSGDSLYFQFVVGDRIVATINNLTYSDGKYSGTLDIPVNIPADAMLTISFRKTEQPKQEV